MPAASLPADESFAEARAAFERVRESRPDLYREGTYSIAGRPVRVRIVGARLAQTVVRPFAHLAEQPDEESRVGALTVDLWDEEETGFPWAPIMPLGFQDEIRLQEGGCLRLSESDRVVLHIADNWSSLYDRGRRHAVGWWSSAGTMGLAERGRPLTRILTLWCHDQRVILMHAGLVAWDGAGTLIIGPGGAGKSTVTLASACAGFDILSDDTVAVERHAGSASVGHSLFGSIQIASELVSRVGAAFSRQLTAETQQGEDKAMLFLQETGPGRFCPSASISAMVLPRIVEDGAVRLSVGSPREAMRALMPGTLWFTEPLHGLMALKRIAELTESIPIYHLEVGRDLASIPQRLEELLVQPSLATAS